MGKRLLSFLVICLCAFSVAFAQKKVTGKVIDKSTGEPVVGASVLVKGSSIGAATDINGNFTINNVPNNAKVLSVSYIGMVPTEVGIRNGIRILMEPDTKTLDEQIVVAYGTAKKSTYTGAVTEVKADDIAAHVSTSVVSALKNSVAGMQVTSSNGDPASESNSIKIHGTGSIYASNSPLIVLDGMPYDGSMSNINPQDVESMSVLKDATASAIYGARGANGVILITTKKGRKQDAEIHFDAKWGSNSRAIPQYDVITEPGQYYETAYKQLYNSLALNGATHADAYDYANRALLDADNGGLGVLVYTVPEGENLIGTNFKLNPNAKLGYSDGEYYYKPDDWYKEAIHNSFRQEYNFSISGATDRFNYYASVGYLDQNGIVNNSDFQRYTARTNVDYQVKKWFKVAAQMSFSHADYQQPDYTTSSWASSGNIFYLANNMGPIYPLYVRDANGNIMHDSNGLVMYDSNQTNQKHPNRAGNAVRDNEYDRSQTFRDNFSGQWSAIFTPVEGLVLSANIGVYSNNARSNYLYSTFANATNVDGGAEAYHSRYFTVNNRYQADYATDFGTEETHNLTATLGYEQFRSKSQTVDAYRTHLYNPTVGEVSNGFGPYDATNISASSATANYMTEGIFARVSYDYKEKYVIQANYRRDASSYFAPGHRWGNFYSVGLAWNIAKENFMESVTAVDLLKLRASFGELGNDNLGSYNPWATAYSISYDPNSGNYSKVLAQLGNDDLTWEKTHDFEAGIDFGLFRNRLSGTLGFYHKSNVNILYYLSQPLSSGFGSIQKPLNVGSVRNVGVELQLNYTPIRTKDLTWDILFNLSSNKNTVTSLDKSIPADGIKGSSTIRRVGGSLYEAYVYKFAGIYTKDNYCGESFDPLKEGKAMFYYNVTDKNGKETGEIDRTTVFSKANQYDLGDICPKVTGGIGTNLQYKNFDANIALGYQLGGRFYDSQYQALMHTDATAIGNAWHKDVLNSWTPENPTSLIPRLDGDTSIGQSAIDMYYTSSNYLSINNISVGYTFPKTLTTRIGIDGLRLYVAGENLWVFSARKGLDPRFGMGTGSYTSGAGYASGNYSAMRTITGGLTLSF